MRNPLDTLEDNYLKLNRKIYNKTYENREKIKYMYGQIIIIISTFVNLLSIFILGYLGFRMITQSFFYSKTELILVGIVFVNIAFLLSMVMSEQFKDIFKKRKKE